MVEKKKKEKFSNTSISLQEICTDRKDIQQ